MYDFIATTIGVTLTVGVVWLTYYSRRPKLRRPTYNKLRAYSYPRWLNQSTWELYTALHYEALSRDQLYRSTALYVSRCVLEGTSDHFIYPADVWTLVHNYWLNGE